MRHGWQLLTIALVLNACGDISTAPPRSTAPTSTPTLARPATTVGGSLTAATVQVVVRGAGSCTHVPEVPSPECDPRALGGATVALVDSGGHTAARGSTGEDGVVSLTVTSGSYALVSDPVSGFDLTPAPMPLQVQAAQVLRVVLTHNTGFQ